MSARLVVEGLQLRSFRNVAELTLRPNARLNLLFGDNGHGKTSVLEALYAVATTRSFRTEKLAQVVRTGDETAQVRARVREAELTRELLLRVGPRGRSVELDGKRPQTLASYAVRTPIVVFHPGELRLVSGPASERRRLLDRLVLYADPAGAEALKRYGEALKNRQHLLETRGGNATELGAFEEVAAEHGARLSRARAEAVARLEPILHEAFVEVAASSFELSANYVAGGSLDSERFRLEFSQRRGVDARRGSASFGPQKDELELCVDGRPARAAASQGQQRLLSLSLKLAELRAIEAVRHAQPILLLDDVSSELDEDRTRSVLSFLERASGQIFVTTTRPELFRMTAFPSAERSEFRLVDGKLGGLAETR